MIKKSVQAIEEVSKGRVKYFIIVMLLIALGLLSRSKFMIDIEFLKEYAGDTIWATMVFFIFRAILINQSLRCVVTTSLAFCFVIEFSQMYHAEWIDSIRTNPLAALVLGQGFKATDLLCYTLGVTLGGVFENIMRISRNR